MIVGVDTFSKWVEVQLIPDKSSWRVADFLWRDIVSRWGKPAWIRTDNGTEFKGVTETLCSALGIKMRRITVGNSRANG